MLHRGKRGKEERGVEEKPESGGELDVHLGNHSPTPPFLSTREPRVPGQYDREAEPSWGRNADYTCGDANCARSPNPCTETWIRNEGERACTPAGGDELEPGASPATNSQEYRRPTGSSGRALHGTRR